MNTQLEINPGAKIEFRRPGARGRPTVAFVIEKNARSLTVERTTNHEVVKIKPSDVVRLAATGRRMKPKKEEVAKKTRAPKAEIPQENKAETKTAKPRPARKTDMSNTVKELTGTARRGRPKKDVAPKAATTKESSPQPKRRGRPPKNQD